MSSPESRLAPGTYKFTVKSVDQAVSLIREKLGPAARVLSVRSVESTGLKKLWSGPKLEVIAQIDPVAASVPTPLTPPATTTISAVSSDLALPEETSPKRGEGGRLTPLPSTLGLSGLLRRSGITEIALNRLQAGPNWNELNALPLHRALAETSRLLRTQAESRPARATISRAAFIGASGVGRTTALCKWLAQDVVRRARLGHVVSVEFDRPNPLGPLPVFTEAMGIPLAHFPCETGPAVVNGFVYFDVPCLSPRRPQDNAQLANFLDTERINERVLVLNAAYDRASLRNAYSAGRDLGATHLVFTHLDEVPQWGKLWDYLFDEALEPLFLATGPSLTGDCEEDVPGAIVRRTLPDDHT